ncbi:hypothetical protein DFH11DRAFT_1549013 [Phellopilus nigrolimitatus]|nr:hypothetical protein DFH11DRAFT_1549013 [Phellopilus nigrolimitatus]
MSCTSRLSSSRTIVLQTLGSAQFSKHRPKSRSVSVKLAWRTEDYVGHGADMGCEDGAWSCERAGGDVLAPTMCRNAKHGHGKRISVNGENGFRTKCAEWLGSMHPPTEQQDLHVQKAANVSVVRAERTWRSGALTGFSLPALPTASGRIKPTVLSTDSASRRLKGSTAALRMVGARRVAETGVALRGRSFETARLARKIDTDSAALASRAGDFVCDSIRKQYASRVHGLDCVGSMHPPTGAVESGTHECNPPPPLIPAVDGGSVFLVSAVHIPAARFFTATYFVLSALRFLPSISARRPVLHPNMAESGPEAVAKFPRCEKAFRAGPGPVLQLLARSRYMRCRMLLHSVMGTRTFFR